MKTVSSTAPFKVRNMGRSKVERFLLTRANHKRKQRADAFKHWVAKRSGKHDENDCMICQQLILARESEAMGDSNPGEVFDDA